MSYKFGKTEVVCSVGNDIDAILTVDNFYIRTLRCPTKAPPKRTFSVVHQALAIFKIAGEPDRPHRLHGCRCSHLQPAVQVHAGRLPEQDSGRLQRLVQRGHLTFVQVADNGVASGALRTNADIRISGFDLCGSCSVLAFAAPPPPPFATDSTFGDIFGQHRSLETRLWRAWLQHLPGLRARTGPRTRPRPHLCTQFADECQLQRGIQWPAG